MVGVDVEIPSAGASMPGYAALPSGATRGVVVLHEIFGRQPDIDRVVERFATAGYAAVGPDLFHDGSQLGCIRRALATISSGEGPFAERIGEAQRWLVANAKLDEARVGVIGFCLGGGLALAVGRRFAAVSTNYGDLPPAAVLRGSPPIIGCYGGRDRIFARNAKRLRERMESLGEQPEIHVFPTVGHSFLTNGHHPITKVVSWPLLHVRWDPEVAEAGWTKILAFFDQSL